MPVCDRTVSSLLGSTHPPPWWEGLFKACSCFTVTLRRITILARAKFVCLMRVALEEANSCMQLFDNEGQALGLGGAGGGGGRQRACGREGGRETEEAGTWAHVEFDSVGSARRLGWKEIDDFVIFRTPSYL